jgi:hypothetical protein
MSLSIPSGTFIKRPAWTYADILWFLFCFSLSLLGIKFADYALLNLDVGAIIAFAQEMLKGKQLYSDLITSQFPLIFYISMIPLGIHALTGISVPEAFFLFMFVLLQGCVLLSWRIAQEGILRDALRTQRYAMLFALYYAVFILPLQGEEYSTNFGQREPLFCALILPYLMLALNRLRGETSSSLICVAAGTLAAFGFNIKPHFFLIFMLSEGFVLICLRRFSIWSRIECRVILVLTVAYYTAFVLGCSEYFVLLPKLAENYHAFQQTWPRTIFQAVFYGMAAIVGCIIFRRSLSRNVLFFLVLVAGAEAMYLSYKGWLFYRSYPILFFSLLLLVLGVLESGGTWRAFATILCFIGYISMIRAPFDLSKINMHRQEVLTEAGMIAPYKTVIFLNSDIVNFPIVNYAGTESLLGMAFLEYLPVAYIRYQGTNLQIVYHDPAAMGANERFFHEKVIKNLQQLPDAIVIFEGPVKYPHFKFDLLHYFLLDPRFQEIWRHYEYAGQVSRKYVPPAQLGAYDVIYRRKY